MIAIGEADQWIESLDLRRHPEGGWFREIYRAGDTIPQEVLPSGFTRERPFSTAIYYLLRGPEISALHRLRQDELWHFYCGAPLTIHVLDADGVHSPIVLGRDVELGEQLVAVIPGGSVFGAVLNDRSSYALVGCTVAPGFDFDDFVMPGRAELLDRYPQHRDIVELLTRNT